MHSCPKLLWLFVISSLVGCSTTSPDGSLEHDYAGPPFTSTIDTPAATKKSDKAEAPSKPSHHEEVKTHDPVQVLGHLLEGNSRFVKSETLHENQDPLTRKELAKGQHPPAIILSCSDSRVAPEIVFDQGLGDIFVVRTAGEVADPVALASMEYAVEHLGSSLIMVLGHESCGAVKAALSTPEGQSAGSPSLDILIAKIRPNISKAPLQMNDPLLVGPVKANITGVSKSLSESSKIIRERIKAKKLAIVKAIYHLESGKVEVLK